MHLNAVHMRLTPYTGPMGDLQLPWHRILFPGKAGMCREATSSQSDSLPYAMYEYVYGGMTYHVRGLCRRLSEASKLASHFHAMVEHLAVHRRGRVTALCPGPQPWGLSSGG